MLREVNVKATEQYLMDFWKVIPVTVFLKLWSFSAKLISHFGTMYRSEQLETRFLCTEIPKIELRTKPKRAHQERLIKLVVTQLQQDSKI